MSKAFTLAVRLLARREHGAHELFGKLIKKGFVSAEARGAVEECQRLGLQSDERFVESLGRVRIQQGYGPLRIGHELKQLQIDGVLIDDWLAREQENWLTHAMEVWSKKYQEQDELTYAKVQKQKKFLLYRGFPPDLITRMFKDEMTFTFQTS